jgi:molybdopterin synthase sulfur carrier subunit
MPERVAPTAQSEEQAGTPAGGPVVVVLRLFAAAREAAGTSQAALEGATVADVLQQASRRYGEAFSSVLAASRVWVNGQPADTTTALAAGDEVAVLPPVSGGCGS